MQKSFPVVVRQVTFVEPTPYQNIRPEDKDDGRYQAFYFVKASSDGWVKNPGPGYFPGGDVPDRVSVHFRLDEADGAPRVGALMTVTVTSDVEIGAD